MDNEFECLRDELKPIILNVAAASEHVPEIEQQIWVIKERARAIKCTLPFKKIPTIMIIKIINFAIVWLNAFPPKAGISTTLSPRAIIVGTQLDYKKHCRAPFSAYMQTHKENTPTNNLKDRSLAAICLGPLFNLQGGYKFLNLKTGKKMHRRHFDELPMPNWVIARVKELAE
eukprot:7249793-Ditylum_brightwellii.AAC.2